jgi:hypothetical protein
VIGHEAVRNYFKLIFGPCARNLLEDQIHDVVRREQFLASIRAECQGISVGSKIVERLEMTGIAGAHARGGARRIPQVPLKPDTTVSLHGSGQVRRKPDIMISR